MLMKEHKNAPRNTRKRDHHASPQELPRRGNEKDLMTTEAHVANILRPSLYWNLNTPTRQVNLFDDQEHENAPRNAWKPDHLASPQELPRRRQRERI